MSLNLLPSQAKFQVEKIRAITLSKRLLTIFLIIWIVLVVFIFGFEQGGKWWLLKQKAGYQTVLASYLQLSTEIVVSQTIKFRAKLLGKVLADRFEYAQAFNIVGKAFDSSFKIKDFELKDKSFFLVSVIADSDESMKLLESRIGEINLGKEAAIKNIVVKSATYSKIENQWLLTVEVYLK